MTSGTALLAALFFPLPMGAAAAAPEAATTKARLEVRADPDCTSRTDLVARVAARSPRIQFVDDAALSAQVQLMTVRPGSVAAEVVLAAADSKPSPRRVLAHSCAEAADAVALIIAVTLDPTLARKQPTIAVRVPGTASDGGAGSQAGSGGPAKSLSPSEPPAAGAAQATSKPAERPDLAKPPAEPVAVTSTPPPPQSPPAPARYGFGASLVGEVVFGPAPAVMPGVAIYALAAIERESLWSPAVVQGEAHAWRSDLSELRGTASFALDAGSVDACPLRLRWSSLAARPCAAFLVGQMTASGGGADVTGARSFARPFTVAGGTVILTAGIGSIVELTGRLETGVTLIRDSYGFLPESFHRAGLLTTSASLGIGLRWP